MCSSVPYIHPQLFCLQYPLSKMSPFLCISNFLSPAAGISFSGNLSLYALMLSPSLKGQFLSQLSPPPLFPLAATLKFPILICCCLFCCIGYIPFLFSLFIVCANDLVLLSTSAAHSQTHVLYTVIINSFNFSLI